MNSKLYKILKNSIPIVIMIGMIPLIKNDFILSAIYVAIIIVAFTIRRTKNDFLTLFVGLFGMTISEYFFISTGVEAFNRTTLFDMMPLWLPLLWAYGFVVIKRTTETLNA